MKELKIRSDRGPRRRQHRSADWRNNDWGGGGRSRQTNLGWQPNGGGRRGGGLQNDEGEEARANIFIEGKGCRNSPSPFHFAKTKEKHILLPYLITFFIVAGLISPKNVLLLCLDPPPPLLYEKLCSPRGRGGGGGEGARDAPRELAGAAD